MRQVNLVPSGTLIPFNAHTHMRTHARAHMCAGTRTRHTKSTELARTHACEQTRALRSLMRAQPNIRQETDFRTPHSRTPRSTRKHMRANTRVRCASSCTHIPTLARKHISRINARPDHQVNLPTDWFFMLASFAVITFGTRKLCREL